MFSGHSDTSGCRCHPFITNFERICRNPVYADIRRYQISAHIDFFIPSNLRYAGSTLLFVTVRSVPLIYDDIAISRISRRKLR